MDSDTNDDMEDIIPEDGGESEFDDEDKDEDEPIIPFKRRKVTPTLNKQEKIMQKKKHGELPLDWSGQFIQPDIQFTGTLFEPPEILPTPIECFKKFFTDSIFSSIAEQTILFADQVIVHKSFVLLLFILFIYVLLTA